MQEKNIENIVHKFGGSSLADAHRFMEAKKILHGKNEIIVVSAVKDTTSTLQSLLDKAASHQSFASDLQALETKHITIANALLSPSQVASFQKELSHDFNEIQIILTSCDLLGSYSPIMQDKILGFGEIWSAKLLCHYLINEGQNAGYLDASKVLFVKEKNANLVIEWEKTEVALANFLKANSFQQWVITGFIASLEDGTRTTLGRNGSDYSAAIFAKLFRANSLVIWTDVDGVFSADPRKVRHAFALDELSYAEALELAYFGAKVLHPKTIAPAIEAKIPIYIKNSFNPQAPGTRIAGTRHHCEYLCQGITSIDDVALINIEGSGLLGVSGIAARVFSVLHQANISVILISQASSEHSICFAIAKASARKAVEELNEYFQLELMQGQIERIQADKECAIIAAVGDDMVGTPGIAGKLCDTLARSNINIRAIAQGSSERNISLVIKNSDINKALRAVHARFYRSNKTVAIGLIGPGLVGGTLLRQLQETAQYLRKKHQVELCVRGIMNSQRMLLSSDGIDLTSWDNLLEQHGVPADPKIFAEHILADDIPHGVIIDCTAEQSVADCYVEFVNLGLHIITPNKKANSGNFRFYKQLKAQAKKKNIHYLYEATVCAGLPVINTLQDIIKTGDEIISISGVVSGTLSYIFNGIDEKNSFSDMVIKAKELGYTEPDPRDDLSGKDVARKMVCLAREIGLELGLEDVVVHDLVPSELRSCDVAQFLEHLPDFDKKIQEQALTARKQQQKLVYTGSIKTNGTIQVDIQSLPLSDSLARLEGTDNMLVFYTKRYSQQPLVIQGPGAGAEVTAAGIFSDLLRLVSYLSE